MKPGANDLTSPRLSFLPCKVRMVTFSLLGFVMKELLPTQMRKGSLVPNVRPVLLLVLWWERRKQGRSPPR